MSDFFCTYYSIGIRKNSKYQTLIKYSIKGKNWGDHEKKKSMDRDNHVLEVAFSIHIIKLEQYDFLNH